MDVATVDVVVPSASPLAILEVTLPALSESLARAEVAASVFVVDDRPGRTGFDDLVSALGFERVAGPRTGSGAARNAGVALGSANVILLVDDDCEPDPESVHRLVSAANGFRGPVLGGLRPPEGSPEWLRWTYEDGTMTPANAYAPPGTAPVELFCTAYVAIERSEYVAAGGIPEIGDWGPEDALFGVALRRRGRDHLLRVPGAGAVHHFVPSWQEWLQRRQRSGERLAELAATLDAGEAERLLGSFGLAGFGIRPAAKWLASLPTVEITRAPARSWAARAIAAGRESRAFRKRRDELGRRSD